MGFCTTRKLFISTMIVEYMPSMIKSATVPSDIIVAPPKPCRGGHYFQLLKGDLQSQKSIPSDKNISHTFSIEQHHLNIKVCYVVYYHQVIIVGMCYADQVFLAKSDVLTEPYVFRIKQILTERTHLFLADFEFLPPTTSMIMFITPAFGEDDPLLFVYLNCLSHICIRAPV